MDEEVQPVETTSTEATAPVAPAPAPAPTGATPAPVWAAPSPAIGGVTDFSGVYGHYTDPVVPGVDQRAIVFGPQTLPGPRADTTMPAAPSTPAASPTAPMGGFPGGVKKLATGTLPVGRDTNLGVAPSLSTSNGHDPVYPQVRDRVP